jgi:hypothetical protein
MALANGDPFFTRAQAAHLSDAEFAHYAGLGLIAGIGGATSRRMADADAAGKTRDSDQKHIAGLNEEINCLRQELEDLRDAK